MMGAQASQIQKDKILSYIKLGKEEGAEVLVGGDVNHVGEGLEERLLYSANHLQRKQQMRIFQEEIFGPVWRSPLSKMKKKL
jgi:aldehyde dehydrogenase